MFQWNENYITGHALIDEQHKKLFSILQKLYTQTTLEEVYELFEDLLEYTVYHFNAEEEFIHSKNEELAAIHKGKHDVFIQMINEQDLSLIDESSNHFKNDLFNLISDWIKTHVLEEIEVLKNQL